MTIVYRRGVPEDKRLEAAYLYDEAFGAKFSVAIPNREERIHLLSASFHLDFAFCALRGNDLVGLAGFQVKGDSLTSGMTYRTILSHLGVLRGNWAAMILSLYERTPAPGELVMDGIAVKSEVRGQGVGTALLNDLISYATDEKFSKIRLDVIDTNSSAKKLYEKCGFSAVCTERFEYLRWLLGFGASTTMKFTVPATARSEVSATD